MNLSIIPGFSVSGLCFTGIIYVFFADFLNASSTPPLAINIPNYYGRETINIYWFCVLINIC